MGAKAVFFWKTNIAILISMKNCARIPPETNDKWKKLKSEPPYSGVRLQLGISSPEA